MLDFANRPPRSQEDVSLSDTGKILLKLASERGDYRSLVAYGHSARSDIIDSFAGHEIDVTSVVLISHSVSLEGARIISDNAESFAEGLQDWVASRLLAHAVGSEVPA
jgi:hypothetical protein